MGYLEIVLSYTILIFSAFKSELEYEGKNALYNSVRNAVLIGAYIEPVQFCDYAILITQIMFALLFLTAVVNRIVGYSKGTQ